MAINRILPGLLSVVLFVMAGCGEYRKGDMYSSAVTGDTISYVVQKSGDGDRILKLAKELEAKQQQRRNEVNLLVINDSSEVTEGNSVLLVNIDMPDFEDDMLSKGYMGAFGSKMIVQYVVISVDDFDGYFKPVQEEDER